VVPDELAPSRLAEAEVDLSDAAGEVSFDGMHLHLSHPLQICDTPEAYKLGEPHVQGAR
jgi:hypothetical protein